MGQTMGFCVLPKEGVTAAFVLRGQDRKWYRILFPAISTGEAFDRAPEPEQPSKIKSIVYRPRPTFLEYQDENGQRICTELPILAFYDYDGEERLIEGSSYDDGLELPRELSCGTGIGPEELGEQLLDWARAKIKSAATLVARPATEEEWEYIPSRQLGSHA